MEALMRIDLYTKTMLTLIVLLLATIACNSMVRPAGVAAEGPLAGVQVSLIPMVGMFAFDGKTGEIWIYGDNNQAKYGGRITKLGEPLDVTARKK
jgi:hypothetical protein